MSNFDKQYNAREEYNKLVKYSLDPSPEDKEKFDHTLELIEEALKQKIKVYITDPFKPGSIFEITKIHKGKQVMFLKQPQSVAKEFKRQCLTIAKTYKLYCEQIGSTVWVFTERGDFLNLKPVTIFEEKIVEKKVQVLVEKNSADAIKEKDVRKAQYAKKKQYAAHHHVVIDELCEMIINKTL